MCIIPVSAHGTNPASAAMCGMKIVAVGTDSKGNINIEELKKAAEANKENLSALMVCIFLRPCQGCSINGIMKEWNNNNLLFCTISLMFGLYGIEKSGIWPISIHGKSTLSTISPPRWNSLVE